MGFPVRLVNKKLLVFVWLGCLCFSCTGPGIPPGRNVCIDHANIKHLGDKLFCNNTLFTGQLYSLYPNKDSIMLEPYVNGKLNGIAKKWYPNRQLSEARIYIDGFREGIHQGWYPSGKKRFVYLYHADLMEGVAEDWYEDGKPMKKMHYKNGHESGMQTAWQPDGSLMANYMAKNGRNYGLTGVKNCKSVRDSIK